MQQKRTETYSQSIFNERHEIFTQNRKISPRQIRRALTLEIFGISSLLLPSYLAKNSGIFGVAAIFAGAAGALGLLCVWERVGQWADRTCNFRRRMEDEANVSPALKDRQASSQNCISGRLVCVGKVLCGAGLLLFSSYVLSLLTSLMRNQLLNERCEIMILLTLAGAGFFGLCKGLESRIRIYEVLFWFLLVPLVVILIVASVSVTPTFWLLTEMSVGGFVKSCIASFLFFALSSLVLLFRPHCSKPERAVGSARVGVGIAAVLNVVIYLILLGVFQQKLLENLEFPVILLMAVVKLPGEFFERQDVLMVGIWFFCLFALFDSLMFYGKELLHDGICPIKNTRARNNSNVKCRSDDREEKVSDAKENQKTGNGQARQNKSETRNEKSYGMIWGAACTAAVFTVALIWWL